MGRKPQLIAVQSPQGGSGKTTLAAALAASSARMGRRTLLVDGAVYGCVQVYLSMNHAAERGIESVISQLEIHSEEKAGDSELWLKSYIKNCILPCKGAPGLDLLPNYDPVQMDKLREETGIRLFELIISLEYERIIFDTSSELSEFNLVLAERCDKLILCSDGSVASVLSLKRYLEILDDMKVDRRKTGIVRNRIAKACSMAAGEIEELTGTAVVGNLRDYGTAFRKAQNEGRFLRMRGKVKKAFTAVAETILS